jgi:hypothetical protein
MAAENKGNAASRYSQLQSERSEFEQRADRCAKLTLPTLYDRNLTTKGNRGNIKDPVHSLGARGVNNLASKLLISLLPMNTPFFKLNVDELAMQAMEQEAGVQDEAEGASLKAEVMKGLGVIERSVVADIEEAGDTTAVFEAMKHLLVTGNCLLYVSEEGNARIFDLNKYVVVRDPQGKWLEVVVCEETSPASLSEEQRGLLNDEQTAETASPNATVRVYTHVNRSKGRVKWHQSINGSKVPDTESNVPESGNPWIPMRFLRVDGEDYGRSYVEMYLGDLDSLEVLTQAVRDSATAGAKTVWMVNPNGTTSAKALAKAPNNSIRSGNADDVSVLRLDKYNDLRIAQDMITRIERQLAHAFMINSEVLRDAERVTAEEVRFVAQELDDSLGGIYSLQSKEFQMPYVKRRLFLLRKRENMPEIPPEVKPVIVTGFAALGRGHDREKLIRYARTLAEIYGPEQLPKFINADELNARLAVADGIDTSGLLVTAQDRQQSQEAAQQAQMMDKLGPELIRQGASMAEKSMEGSENGTAPAQAVPTGN